MAQMTKIDHPPHYGGDTTYEAIKVIEAWQLGFHLGNAVKYICRAGLKDSYLDDLRKARWYLDREISRAEHSSLSEAEGSKSVSSVSNTSDPVGALPYVQGAAGSESQTVASEPPECGSRSRVPDGQTFIPLEKFRV